MIPMWVTDLRRVPASALRSVAAEGWNLAEGFDLPEAPWELTGLRWVRWGGVEVEDQLEAALMAAVRGVGVMAACPNEGLRGRLLADLGRVGEVVLAQFGPDPLDALDADQRVLLERLATGSTVAEVADLLYLSNRTAERRLSAARRALGVRTTAEAIALALSSPSMQDQADE